MIVQNVITGETSFSMINQVPQSVSISISWLGIKKPLLGRIKLSLRHHNVCIYNILIMFILPLYILGDQKPISQLFRHRWMFWLDKHITAACFSGDAFSFCRFFFLKGVSMNIVPNSHRKWGISKTISNHPYRDIDFVNMVGKPSKKAMHNQLVIYLFQCFVVALHHYIVDDDSVIYDKT